MPGRATAHWRGWLRSAVLVVAAVAVATTITFVVRAAGSETIFVFFMAAIAVTSLALGAAAGTVAVVLSATVIEVDFAGVWTQQQGSEAADVGQLISFLLVGLLIAQISGALRRSRDRARRLALDAQDARAAAEGAREHAEDASRAKDRFLATMSHEFRTPLNAIVAYADLMRDGVLGDITEKQRDAMNRVNAAGMHLSRLVNDILDVARFDAGTIKVDSHPVRVRDPIKQAVALVQPQAQKKRIALRMSPSRAPIVAVADPDRLRQILTNLLANAVKFTTEGGRVDLSWGLDAESRARIDIRDTGIGIAPDNLERIFQPFEQEENDLTRASVGTGLGLTISRRLAQAMGGDIWVKSARGVGSTFTVVLRSASPAIARRPVTTNGDDSRT